MSISAPVSPPPLREGDRLTADEFLRRWEAMPDLEHVELLDGIVYMPSPISDNHEQPHDVLDRWLILYDESTPGCVRGLPATWRMSGRDVPEPDLTLRVLPEYGGQSRLEGKYRAGAPELVVEGGRLQRSEGSGRKISYLRASGSSRIRSRLSCPGEDSLV